MNTDTYIDEAKRRVKIDVNNTSDLLKRIRDLQFNNTYWSVQCEKLHTLGWYKVGLVVSCALNLAFIFGFIFVGWWLWLK